MKVKLQDSVIIYNHGALSPKLLLGRSLDVHIAASRSMYSIVHGYIDDTYFVARIPVVGLQRWTNETLTFV